MLCGGNIDSTVLGRVIERGLAADGRLLRFSVVVSDRPGGMLKLTKILAENGARYDLLIFNLFFFIIIDFLLLILHSNSLRKMKIKSSVLLACVWTGMYDGMGVVLPF